MNNRMEKELKWLKNYIRILKDSISSKGEKCFMVGVPTHGNLGDQAITLGQYKFIKEAQYNKKVIEIPSLYIRRHTKLFKFIIGKSDIIFNGGGYLGTLWPVEEKMVRDVIKAFPNNKLIVFPQTLYFSDDAEGEKQKKLSKEIYNNHKSLYLFMRETKSYELAKDEMKLKNVFLAPDIVLALDPFEAAINERKGVVFCLRSDKEKVLTDEQEKEIADNVNKYYKDEKITYTDTVISKDVWKNEREVEVYKKIEEFSKAKLVVTDRLHGMVFAALAGTPCIVMGNCNYKVRGIYNWIKNNEYVEFIEDFDALEQIVCKMSQLKDGQKLDKSLTDSNFNELKKCLML